MEANSIGHMLRRDRRVKACRGLPMEKSRLAISPDDIEPYFHRLVAIVDGSPAHFFFSVDGTGHQEWADGEKGTCYELSEHTGNEVPFPVPRSSKRITFVTCTGTGGSFLKLLIVIHRKTIDTDVALARLADEKLAIYSQPKGFVG
jgi:hypothetical protein